MLDPTTLQARIEELAPWHFNIEIASGIWTGGGGAWKSRGGAALLKSSAEMHEMLSRLYPTGLPSKSFLDVACNGGAYCFLAHDLGAATCYGFDIREHWIEQAEFVRSAKYHDHPGLHFAVQDAKTFVTSEQFDITLMKGIFYHLPDPVSTLKRACDATKELLILDTDTHAGTPEDCFKLVAENTDRLMSGVDGLSWLVGGPGVLRTVLSWAGFSHFRVHFWLKQRPNRQRGRIRILGARTVETFTYYDRAVQQIQA